MTIRKFWLETLNLCSVLCFHNPLETPCPAWLSLSHLVDLVGFVVCLMVVDALGVIFLSWPCDQSRKQETQALSPSKSDNEVDPVYCASMFMLFYCVSTFVLF